MYEVRLTKTYATCHYNCETYKDHPKWEMMKKMQRQIPPGEIAFFLEGSCRCYKHAMPIIQRIREEILRAEAMMESYLEQINEV
jgi:hypothetical protein